MIGFSAGAALLLAANTNRSHEPLNQTTTTMLGSSYSYYDSSAIMFFLMSSVFFTLLQDVASSLSASVTNCRYYFDSVAGILSHHRMADHGDERTANLALVRGLQSQRILRAPYEEEARHTQQTPNPAGMMYFNLRLSRFLHLFLGFTWHTVDIRKSGDILTIRSFRAVVNAIAARAHKVQVGAGAGAASAVPGSGFGKDATKSQQHLLLTPQELHALDLLTFTIPLLILACFFFVVLIVFRAVGLEETETTAKISAGVILFVVASSLALAKSWWFYCRVFAPWITDGAGCAPSASVITLEREKKKAHDHDPHHHHHELADVSEVLEIKVDPEDKTESETVGQQDANEDDQEEDFAEPEEVQLAEYKWTVADHRMEGRPTDSLCGEVIATHLRRGLQLDQTALDCLAQLPQRAILIRMDPEASLSMESRLLLFSAALASLQPQLDVEYFQWEPLRAAWLSMYATSWAQKQGVNSPGRLFVPFLRVDASFTAELVDRETRKMELKMGSGGALVQPEVRSLADLRSCVDILLSSSKVPQGATLLVFLEEDDEFDFGTADANIGTKKISKSGLVKSWERLMRDYGSCTLTMTKDGLLGDSF
eukprot:g29.t1